MGDDDTTHTEDTTTATIIGSSADDAEAPPQHAPQQLGNGDADGTSAHGTVNGRSAAAVFSRSLSEFRAQAEQSLRSEATQALQLMRSLIEKASGATAERRGRHSYGRGEDHAQQQQQQQQGWLEAAEAAGHELTEVFERAIRGVGRHAETMSDEHRDAHRSEMRTQAAGFKIRLNASRKALKVSLQNNEAVEHGSAQHRNPPSPPGGDADESLALQEALEAKEALERKVESLNGRYHLLGEEKRACAEQLAISESEVARLRDELQSLQQDAGMRSLRESWEDDPAAMEVEVERACLLAGVQEADADRERSEMALESQLRAAHAADLDELSRCHASAMQQTEQRLDELCAEAARQHASLVEARDRAKRAADATDAVCKAQVRELVDHLRTELEETAHGARKDLSMLHARMLAESETLCHEVCGWPQEPVPLLPPLPPPHLAVELPWTPNQMDPHHTPHTRARLCVTVRGARRVCMSSTCIDVCPRVGVWGRGALLIGVLPRGGGPSQRTRERARAAAR